MRILAILVAIVVLWSIDGIVEAFSGPRSAALCRARVAMPSTVWTPASSSATCSAVWPLYAFQPDPDRPKRTRENEPEQYFATNLDKKTDQEKIPIAIAGLVFISLPFIVGLIALVLRQQ